MKKDILYRNDIVHLVNAFYEKVKSDDLLDIFYDSSNVNWGSLLPGMYDFWENAILYTGNYSGSPMQLNKYLNNIRPLNAAHFERLNELFISTVDDLFEGEKATLAKQRALSLSALMQIQVSKYQVDIDKIY